MRQNFLLSRLFAPLVPRFVMARWGRPVDRALAVADAVLHGRDENALSLRTAFYTFSIRILSAVIAYVSQVLMARWLGSYEYGVFVWVWVAAVIIGGLASIGFPSAVIRFIPQYQVANDLSSIRGLLFSSRLYCVVFATLIAALGALGIYLASDLVSNIFIAPLYLGLICLPMLALSGAQDGIARAFNWANLFLSPTFLVRPILILVFMVLALLADFEHTARTALLAAIAATWITAIGQMLILNRRISGEIPRGEKTYHSRVWIKVALPILLVEGFFSLLTNIDILIAGVYLPPQDVAVYFAAVKTLALVHFVYFAVKAAAAHRYSQYFSAGDTPRYEAFVRNTVRWTFWPSLAMGLLLITVGKYLLILFGPEFAKGYPLLVILVVGIIARASVGPSESVLTMSGQQNVCAAVYGVTLFVNVFLSITLIPAYGLYGAAISTTIAMVFEAFALYAITLRTLGLHMFIFSPQPSARKVN